MISAFFCSLLATVAPFGAWQTPLTTEKLVEDKIAFREMQADEKALYWIELHPQEKGRMALVKYSQEESPLLPQISVKTRVHEYGGGAFSLKEGKLIFSNDADSQLYLLTEEGVLQKLTDTPQHRYADGDGLIWVCEKHDATGGLYEHAINENAKVENCLVRIQETGVQVLDAGHDFYSSPRLSPDGKKLAYITWDFPDMQWDNATLWLAEIDANGNLYNTQAIAGGVEESIVQIKWNQDALYFVSDRTGFWNLYCYKNGNVESLCTMQAEFGAAPWQFGDPTYAFLSDGRIACTYTIQGVDYFGLLDPQTKQLEGLNLPFTFIYNVVAFKDKVYFFGATPTLPISLICLDPKTGHFSILKQTSKDVLEKEWISTAQVIQYPSLDGKIGYAFYYPPKNPNYSGPKGQLPPLLVESHGGPTSQSYSFLGMGIQFWTTRGFGFLAVNYGGSTGYGREYLKRLEGNWGVLDVDDCISAAKVLIQQEMVDEKNIFIRGASAGGYTTLAALTFRDFFTAGTSYFGISDLDLLYRDAHKFEWKYTDRLVAPATEEKLIWQRSPIHYVEQLKVPLLLLQGEEDKIVPPNQASCMFEAVKTRGIPVGMLIFKEEGHGFNQAPNIKRSLDAELYFYSKILQLEIPFAEPPIEIVNLEALQ